QVVEPVDVDDQVELRAEREQIDDAQELLRLLVAGEPQTHRHQRLAAIHGQLGEPREQVRGALFVEYLGKRSADERDDDAVRRAPRRRRRERTPHAARRGPGPRWREAEGGMQALA